MTAPKDKLAVVTGGAVRVKPSAVVWPMRDTMS